MTTVADAPTQTPVRTPVILRRPKQTTGVWSWFTTVDHKKIGIMYGVDRARLLPASAASRRC